MTENPSTFESACRTLYRSYGIMNRVCWQDRLPASRLALSGRMAPHTAAYAQDAGPGDLRIVFNAETCRLLNDADFLQIMAHEMIHIFQYAQGRRGGHGRDFRNEQVRLGLILGAVIQPDSPFGYVLFMHGLQELHPAAAVRELAAHRVPRTRYAEYFRSLRERTPPDRRP